MTASPAETPFYLLDTDTMSRYRTGNAPIAARLLSLSPEQVAISVITVEEQLNGWYIHLRQPQSDARLADVYERIARTVEVLGQFRVLTFDVTAITRKQAVAERKTKEPPYVPDESKRKGCLVFANGSLTYLNPSCCPLMLKARLVSMI